MSEFLQSLASNKIRALLIEVHYFSFVEIVNQDYMLPNGDFRGLSQSGYLATFSSSHFCWLIFDLWVCYWIIFACEGPNFGQDIFSLSVPCWSIFWKSQPEPRYLRRINPSIQSSKFNLVSEYPIIIVVIDVLPCIISDVSVRVKISLGGHASKGCKEYIRLIIEDVFDWLLRMHDYCWSSSDLFDL